ncbi:MAG: hypothetical protein J6386_07095 [Candidatus Synoicihabitans palmerolidicus]|nr:hypothetical protein [Candidatus Synoicihabitans palmerolidicus]
MKCSIVTVELFGRLGRRVRRGLGIGLVGLGSMSGQVEPSGFESTSARITVTRINQIWAMTPEERDEEHRLRIEGQVSFADAEWGNLWFEHEGVGYYAALADAAPAFRTGQRFRLEGTFVPNRGLSARTTSLTISPQLVTPEPLDTSGQIGDIARFDKRMVVVEGLVDLTQVIDERHVRLMMIVENRPVVCWVRPTSLQVLPDLVGKDLVGKLVRVKGVYLGRLDPTGTESTIELWVDTERAIEDVGALEDDPRFEAEVTPVGDTSALEPGATLLLRGVMVERVVGEGACCGKDKLTFKCGRFSGR